MSKPLTIWAVSDGRAGIESQVLGLAEAVARQTPADIVTRHIRYAAAFDRWPTLLKVLPDAMLARDSDRIEAPWPDIWIAAGRATLPHSLRMRRRSGGQTLVVQLQDPKLGYHDFDLVIAPEHDNLTFAHVLPLLGSTNRITPERLASEYAPWRERIEALPAPRIAVLIGGRSKVYDLGEARAETLAGQIRTAVTEAGGALLLSLSRRTPPDARAVFERVLSDLPGIVYTGEGPNPYFAFMHAADHILVTEDSVNMATEAAGTGRPVHLLGMDRLRPSQKFDIFHKNLRMHGIARPFTGKLDSWTYIPLDETARAARHLLQVLDEKRSGGRVIG